MKKYLIIVFLIGIWSCEDAKESQTIKFLKVSEVMNDGGYDVIQSVNDEYFIVGRREGNIYDPNMGMTLQKIDSDGNELWYKTFVNQSSNIVSIDFSNDGDLIMGGYKYDSDIDNNVPTLIKTDIDGNLQWIKEYDLNITNQVGGIINDVKTTFDNTFRFSTYKGVVKSNLDGTMEWVHQMNENKRCLAIEIDDDGNTMFVGYEDTELIIGKLDIDGQLMWDKKYNERNQTAGHSIDITDDGGFIITGYSSLGGTYGYLLRTDSFGNKLWDKYFEISDAIFIMKVVNTNDGGFLVMGYNTSGFWISEINLIHFDLDGKETWRKVITKPNENLRGYSVIQTSDGGYFITGVYGDEGGILQNTLLLKTDSNGNFE